jgi:endonuclease YncB( thermonuclease family)
MMDAIAAKVNKWSGFGKEQCAGSERCYRTDFASQCCFIVGSKTPLSSLAGSRQPLADKVSTGFSSGSGMKRAFVKPYALKDFPSQKPNVYSVSASTSVCSANHALVVAAAAVVLLTFVTPSDMHGADDFTIRGQARVVDGDTFVINKSRVRLRGIDAFEMNQSCRDGKGNKYDCGKYAKSAMTSMINGRVVQCTGRSYDKYGRLIGTCTTVGNEDRDLGAELVRQGWALAYRSYSGKYIRQEKEAHKAQRGAWVGSFEKPWKHRTSPGRHKASSKH